MNTGLLEELKVLIKGVVMSCPEGITVNQLQRDFRSMEGHPIPYQKVGYPSLDAFLQSIGDTVYVVGSGPGALVGIVKNKKSEHIVNMIHQQRKAKTRSNKRTVRKPLPPCNPSTQVRNTPLNANSLSKNANSPSVNANNHGRYAQTMQGIINANRSNFNPPSHSIINNSGNAYTQATRTIFHPPAPPICFNFTNPSSTISSNNYNNAVRNVPIPWQPPISVHHPFAVPPNFNTFASTGYQFLPDSANRAHISFQFRNTNVQKAKEIPSMQSNLETNQKPYSHRNPENRKTEKNLNENHFGNSLPKINCENSANPNQREKPHAELRQYDLNSDDPEPKNPVKVNNAVSVEKSSPVARNNTTKPDFEDCKTLPEPGDIIESNNLSSSFKKLQIQQKDLRMPAKADVNASLKTKNVTESSSDNSSDYSCNKNQMRVSDWETDLNDTEEAVPKFAVNELIYHLDFPLKTVPFGVKIVEAKLPSEITIGSMMGIFISEIHSPFHFWFHIHSKNMHLDDLMERLDNYYKFLDADSFCIPPICIIPGQVCASLYYNAWHRAEILSEAKDNKVKVIFLDYGTISEVNIQNIKYLHTTFAELPAQVHRGCLSHIKPNGLHWTEEGTMRFIAMAFDLMLWARVADIDETSRISYMVLCDTNGPEAIQINEVLVEAGFAFYDAEWNKTNNLLLSAFAKMSDGVTNDWNIYYWATEMKPTAPERENVIMQIPKVDVSNLDREQRLRQPGLFEMIESAAYPTLWEISLLQQAGVKYEDIIDALLFQQDKMNLKKSVLETVRQVVEKPACFLFKSDLRTQSH